LSFVGYLYFAPSPIEPCPVLLPPYQPMEGPLAPNNLLSNPTLLFKDHQRKENEYPSHLRAEAFAEDGHGGFYSGLGDGRIVHFVNLNQEGTPPSFTMETIIRTGSYSSQCGTLEMEYVCGRPLGLQFHPKTGHLFIADTRGLLELDLETNVLKTIATEFEGVPLRLINSIAITKNGKLYFTDSSSKWSRSQVFNELIENCGYGRLLSYDPDTGKIEKLLDSLFFPNGIQLTPSEDALIFAETTRYRISKYYLTGPKKGSTELFTETPGFPDNIKYSHESDVYWVGLTRRAPPISMLDLLYSTTWFRKYFAKIFPTSFILLYNPPSGMVVAINQEGKIVKSLFDPSGEIQFVSEVAEQNGYLFIGSWRNDYIALVDGRQYLPL